MYLDIIAIRNPTQTKMKFNCPLAFIIAFCILGVQSLNAHLLEESTSSFALEYRELRILLQKVDNEQAATTYKHAIKQQIERLKQNQATGEQSFASMSETEQQLFVKKFQNNRFHCGEVTQVMAERQRILLRPELSNILRDVLDEIP